MKRIDRQLSDPRFYPDPEPKPGITPHLSAAQLTSRLCAHCKTNEIPRSTMANPVPANRKYCDACIPIVQQLQRAMYRNKLK